jgi:glycosyltransferase involved in cell wall biosynthesis
MRIGMFTELYPPSVGGVEARFAELAAALVKAGHEVDVYCIGHQRAMVSYALEGGIGVHRQPIIVDYRRSIVPGMPRNVAAILRYGWDVRQALRHREFDLHIFGQWPFSHVLFAPRRARRRGLIDWCEVRGGPVYGRFERWFPRLTALNMGVSTAVAEQIESASGRPVFSLSSGVTISNYLSAPERERQGILYVGRLFPHKRVPLLVAAFGVLRGRGYRGRLTIAGDGPARTEIDAARSQLPPTDGAAVDITGHIDDRAKISLLGHAAVLVLPSQREGFPLAVAEAMASGLPVVTTSDPGNGTRNVVEQFGIGVVADPTVEALATAVDEVLGSWSHYSANALAAAPELDWDHIVVAFGKILVENGWTT